LGTHTAFGTATAVMLYPLVGDTVRSLALAALIDFSNCAMFTISSEVGSNHVESMATVLGDPQRASPTNPIFHCSTPLSRAAQGGNGTAHVTPSTWAPLPLGK